MGPSFGVVRKSELLPMKFSNLKSSLGRFWAISYKEMSYLRSQLVTMSFSTCRYKTVCPAAYSGRWDGVSKAALAFLTGLSCCSEGSFSETSGVARGLPSGAFLLGTVTALMGAGILLFALL